MLQKSKQSVWLEIEILMTKQVVEGIIMAIMVGKGPAILKTNMVPQSPLLPALLSVLEKQD